jgi:hypothetical protein
MVQVYRTDCGLDRRTVDHCQCDHILQRTGRSTLWARLLWWHCYQRRILLWLRLANSRLKGQSRDQQPPPLLMVATTVGVLAGVVRLALDIHHLAAAAASSQQQQLTSSGCFCWRPQTALPSFTRSKRSTTSGRAAAAAAFKQLII